MNPGPLEEGAKVATTFIDAMKQNPLVLAVLVFALVAVVFIFLATSEFRAQSKEVMNELLSQHKELTSLLSRCVVPGTPTLIGGSDAVSRD